jgi:hypothetical protein
VTNLCFERLLASSSGVFQYIFAFVIPDYQVYARAWFNQEKRKMETPFVKLIALAIFNAMFRSKSMTNRLQRADGFHVLEYEGKPSVVPGLVVVKLNHRINGELQPAKRWKTSEQGWQQICQGIQTPHSKLP